MEKQLELIPKEPTSTEEQIQEQGNENQLLQIIQKSDLDQSKSQILLDKFSEYFKIAAEWEKKASELIVTSADQKVEIKMASEGRKFLKEKRVAIEHTRVSLKEASLREGQTIDAIAKILKNLIEPIEEDLSKKEKFIEIQEAKKKEELRIFRTQEVVHYAQFIPYGIDLSAISEEDYGKLLNGAKLQLQAKIDADNKAEAERIAKQKAEELNKSRRELCAPYVQFIEDFQKDLSEFTEEEFDIYLQDVKKKKEDYDSEQERIRKENEALKAREAQRQKEKAITTERQNKLIALGLVFDGQQFCYKDVNFHWTEILTMSEKDFNTQYSGAENRMKQIKAEEKLEQERIEKANREKQERDLLQQTRLNELLPYNTYGETIDMLTLSSLTESQYQSILLSKRTEFEKKQAEAKAEKEEKERLEKELQQKKDAEAKAEKERLAAEEKAAKAPDKKKLILAVESLNIHLSELKSDKSKEIEKQLLEKLEAYKKWAKGLIEGI